MSSDFRAGTYYFFEGPSARGRAGSLVALEQQRARGRAFKLDSLAGTADVALSLESLKADSAVRFCRGEIVSVLSWLSRSAVGTPEFDFWFSGVRGLVKPGAEGVDLLATLTSVDLASPSVRQMMMKGPMDIDPIVPMDDPRVTMGQISGRYDLDDEGRLRIESSSGSEDQDWTLEIQVQDQ